MSCSTGLISTVNKILNNKPWFKYNPKTGYIKILESPNSKINSQTIPGVANSVAASINKAVAKEYPQVGQVAYFTYIDNVAGVVVSPTNRQLDIFNQADRAEEASILADLELEQQLRDFEERQREGNWIDNEGEVVSQDDINFQPTIKPGVKELLESNPELADAVYEALGFNNLITPNDKIVFGHPGIGKTYLRESGRTDVIDFDSDYKTKINEKFNLPKGFKARNDFQKSNKEEYQKAVRELWIEAKKEAKSKGKQLFASDMILLREFANDFDKVITMSKDTFVNRAKQRNDYTEGETEKWKNSLDTEISKINKSKVINTNEYLSDLFITQQQKQQAQQLYSQYLDSKQPDVILPIGTSGSGKSTFIKSLPQENLVVIEPDAMRVEFTGNMNDKSKDKEIYEEAAKRAVKAIKAGKQVVFDTTNLTKDKRLPFIEAIKKAIPTANIQYKLMELNPELAKQRIKAQLERGENRAVVSDETIDRHAVSYKQMLKDIKNEPITEYKELGSKQDIEGFKAWTNNENSLNFQPAVDNNLTRFFDRPTIHRSSSIAKAEEQKIIGEVSTVEMLEQIGRSKHPLAPVAKKLLHTLRKGKRYDDVPIVLREGKPEGFKIANYVHYPRHVNLWKDANYPQGSSESTIIHEILHSMSVGILLKEDNDNVKHFTVLMEEARKHFSAYDPATNKGTYALYNEHEFLVALYTNTEFIKALSKIPPVDKSEFRNLMEEIFTYLLDLLGISKTDSLYSQAFAVATNIIEEQQINNAEFVDFQEVLNQESLKEYLEELDTLGLTQAERTEAVAIYEETEDVDNNFNMQPAIKSFDNIASYLSDLLNRTIDKHKRWKLSQVHNYGKAEYKKRNSEYFSIIEKLTNELASIDVTNKDTTTNFIQSEIAYLSSIIDNIDDNIIASENLIERINFLSSNILGIDLDGIESDVMWDGTGIPNFADRVVVPLNALILKLRTYRSQMVDRLVQESPAFSYMREDLTQAEFEDLMRAYFEGSLKDINDFQRDFLGLNANDDSGFMALAYELYHKNILKNKTYTRDKVNKFIKLSDLLMEKGFSLDKFLEKDTDGIDTGNIINRFTSTYTNQALPRLFKLIKAYREEKDFKSAQKATAYRNIISWYKTYTNVIDYRKLRAMKVNYETHPEYGKHFTFSDAEIDAYEAQLIADVGQDYFDSIVDSAVAKMEEFEIQHLNKLAANNQWTNVYVAENSPLVFAENYFGATPFNPIALAPTFRRFNNSHFIEFVPKKTTTDVNGNTIDTGFYNSEFDEIENDDTAYEYWKTLTDLYQNYINPTYIEGGQDINLLSWAKIENTFVDEIIKNKGNIKGISKAILDAWKDLWFDDTKSHNPDEIRSNYFDTTSPDIEKYVNAIINYSLDEINERARKAGIKTMTLAEIQAQSQSKYATLSYKRFIATKLAKKEVYKNKSKDLTKITHALVELANLQRARQDSVTLMDILYKQHLGVTDTKGQPRENSNSKFRSWIKTNIYNTVEGRDNVTGKTKRYTDFEKELMRILKELTDKVINSNENVEFYLGKGVTLKRENGAYSTTEKDPTTNAVVNTTLTIDEFYDKLSEYVDNEMAKLGKNISVESVVNGVIKASVLKTFVINPVSGLFNRLEGKITNIINDITGRYWTPGNNTNSERFLALANMMKFAGDKISSLHKKHYLQLQTLQQLVDEFNILQDRKNELERRDKESHYGKIKSKFNPFALAVDNPEFKNQVTIMMNILQDLKVKDNNGVEHKFFDPKTMAFTIYKPGTLELKPEFSLYNQNWSTFNFNDTDVLDNDFFLYKERISSAVSELQGNYSNVDSVKIHQKKGVGGLKWGKILMLYMRWLPSHINQRFGKRNVDFIQGKQNQIGRFRGLLKNTGSTATYVGLSATILYGPGAALLAGIPILATLAKMVYDKVFMKKTINTQVLNLKVTAGFMQEVLIKTFGLPVKLMYANKLSNKIDSIQNRKLASLPLSEQRALKAMAQDLAVQVNLLMFMLAIKTLLKGGSEGDDDDSENMFQNFVDNQGNRLINNLAIWSNPLQVISENTKFALFRTIGDVYKFAEDVTKMMMGDKIDVSRPKKTLLRVQPIVPIPNILINYITKGEAPGFENREYANRQWFDRYTKSAKWKKDQEYKAKRAKYKEALKEQLIEDISDDRPELTEDEIMEIVDKKTNSEMRKQNMKKKKGESSEEALKRIDLEYDDEGEE